MAFGRITWWQIDMEKVQGNQTCRSKWKSTLNILWKDWCWHWNFNTLATWCKVLTHWKRPWCWERLKVGGEGDDRGWDGWMESWTQWTWVSVNSGSWWWTERPGVLQSMGLQRVRHDWVIELNWTELRLSSLVVSGLGVSAPTPKAQGLISVQEWRFHKWFVMVLNEIKTNIQNQETKDEPLTNGRYKIR